MSHTLPAARLSPAPAMMTQCDAPTETVAMRQLRHQTKNALQRIIAQIAAANLRSTSAGAQLADELERRICLSAKVSDALFGLTANPGRLGDRLTALCDATVKLLALQEQTIAVTVTVTGRCPQVLDATLVKVAHEMVGNAVKHGMHMRLVGRIDVQVRSSPSGSIVLRVCDDGWGPMGDRVGEGLPIMQCLAEAERGRITIDRADGWTVARLTLPSLA